MAYYSIKTALLEFITMSFDMPSYFYSSLVMSTNDQVIQFRRQLKENLITVLSTEPYAPCKEVLFNASKKHPLTWKPTIHQISNQSNASYREHEQICQILIQSRRHIAQAFLAGELLSWFQKSIEMYKNKFLEEKLYVNAYVEELRRRNYKGIA